MWTKQKRKSASVRFMLPLMTVGIVGYFTYHVFHGEYGLYSCNEVNKHIAELEGELHNVKAERIFIEKRISLLRDGHIEKDMLDEYVRRNLNFSMPNELTILIPFDDIKS
ncbi:FtsB family cell division protein [Bartonella sp. B10]